MVSREQHQWARERWKKEVAKLQSALAAKTKECEGLREEIKWLEPYAEYHEGSEWREFMKHALSKGVKDEVPKP